jgi:hypothetical protein
MSVRLHPTWRSVLWLLFGIVAIVLLRKAQLSYEEKLAPLPMQGALKQRVSARDLVVAVDGFRLARSYRVAGNGSGDAQALRTPGVWMSVALKAEVLREPGPINARLRSRDGYYYQANGDDRPRVRGVNLSGVELAPGLPASGAFFFELPPEQVRGARLQIYRGSLTPGQMDGLVEIDLGTGAQTAEQLKTNTADEIDLRP